MKEDASKNGVKSQKLWRVVIIFWVEVASNAAKDIIITSKEESVKKDGPRKNRKN